MERRIEWLDFIRACATIAIVIFHFNCSIGAHHVYHDVENIPIFFYEYKNGNLGQIGVSVFFILSGASLMYTYKNEISIYKYAVKRWKNIFPMFYCAYIMAAIYYFWVYKSLNPFCVVREGWTFILTLFGMDGYTTPIIGNYYLLGEWFLGAIILMYFIFPCLRWVVLHTNTILVLVLSIMLEILLIENYSFNYPIEYFFLIRMFEFLIGMLLVYKKSEIKIYNFSIALLIVIICLLIDIPVKQIYKTIVMGISVFVVLGYLGGVKKRKNILIKLISSYSYVIFLIHHIIIEQVCSRFENMEYGVADTYVVLFICVVIIAITAKLLKKCLNKIEYYITNAIFYK